MKDNQTKNSKGKQIGKFILMTLIYFVILLSLVYLYEYSGLNSVHFIYDEF